MAGVAPQVEALDEAEDVGFYFKYYGGLSFAKLDEPLQAPGSTGTVAVACKYGLVFFSDLSGAVACAHLTSWQDAQGGKTPPRLAGVLQFTNTVTWVEGRGRPAGSGDTAAAACGTRAAKSAYPHATHLHVQGCTRSPLPTYCNSWTRRSARTGEANGPLSAFGPAPCTKHPATANTKSLTRSRPTSLYSSF